MQSKQSCNFQLLCAEIIRGLRKKRPRMKIRASGGGKKKKKKKRAKGGGGGGGGKQKKKKKKAGQSDIFFIV